MAFLYTFGLPKSNQNGRRPTSSASEQPNPAAKSAVCNHRFDERLIRSHQGRAFTDWRRVARGRALPTWEGCVDLQSGEVLLLGDAPDSFDGRYWGVTPATQIEGVWRPLATRTGAAAPGLP